MNSWRSRSLRLVSSHCKSMEVEIIEHSSTDSSMDNTLYCCIAKGNRILYSYNSKGRELEALASLCLENAPSFHRWYFHTVGTRTFGYLMEGGCTYFAIVDPSLGTLEILRFLKHIRDGLKRVSMNGFHDEVVVPIIQQLISSLQRMPRPATISVDESLEGNVSNDSSISGWTPLLGNSKHDKRKMKDKVVETHEVCEDLVDTVNINMPSEPGGSMSLQKSSSLMRNQAPQVGQRLWWRHAKLVVAADIILCLVLFGVWLAVCKGFKCISDG